MTRVICYLEGPSDKLAMEALLRPVMDDRQNDGVSIGFYDISNGDRKRNVLEKGTDKAITILRNDTDVHVALIPDLYPPNKAFHHETFEELRAGILRRAEKAVKRKRLREDILERFHVFCFKYDLEVLVLAAHESLARHLGVNDLKRTWKDPVEEQNHENPPKRVVEGLFRGHGKKYQGTVDTVAILDGEPLETLVERCPQHFGPLVDWLRTVR